MTLVLFNTYSVRGGAAVKDCFGEPPSNADPPWGTVSIPRGMDREGALRALRKLLAKSRWQSGTQIGCDIHSAESGIKSTYWARTEPQHGMPCLQRDRRDC